MNRPGPLKPLEWHRETYKNCWPQRDAAITPVGRYSVAGSDGKDNWRWYRNGFSCGPDSKIERSNTEAKRAAFRHYAATVASCFSEGATS